MKPKIYLLGAAVAALSLGACSQEELQPEPVNEGYSFAFSVAEDDQTRTTLATSDVLRWVPTDRVGIYTVGANLNPNTLTVADVNQTPVEFIGILQRMVSPGDRFYAYYPYDAAQSSDPAAVVLSIPVVQTQTKANVYNGETHPLVALPMEFPGVQDSYACRMNSVRFRQLGAIVELQLCASDEALRSETIRSVSFEADAPLAGDFTFDLTSVTAKEDLPIAGYESSVVTTALEEPAAIPDAASQAARVYLTIAPGRYSGAIVVRTDIAQYTFRLAAALDFERAVIKGLPADLARAERVEIIPDNQIWYTTTDEKVAPTEEEDLVESNIYANGKGIITFKESIHEVPSYLFGQVLNETRITSIQLPNGVSKINRFAFFRCENLAAIEIPDGVTEIGYAAFGLCDNLKSVYVPASVKVVGGSAFGFCSGLERFEGPYASEDHRCLILGNRLCAFAPAGLNDMATSDSWAYYIKNVVNVIGEGAFHGLRYVKNIVLGDVVKIERNAFTHCPDLHTIFFDYLNTDLVIEDSAFEKCTTFVEFRNATNAPIYLSASKIGNRAFADCSSLTQIDLAFSSIESIGHFAFSGCSSLTNILNIPDSVISIGNYSFQDCSSLTSITIPKNVTSIGDSAFSGCCKLTSIYCKPITPPTLGDDLVFNNTH